MRLYTRLDQRLGRAVFGNTSKFSNTALGRFRVWKNRNQVSVGKAARTSMLRVQGFELPIILADRAIADQCAGDLEKAINETQHVSARGNAGALKEALSFSTALLDPTVSLPNVLDLVDEAITDLLVAFYGGTGFRVRDVLAWRNFHVPDEIVARREVFSNRWHCDEIPSDIVKYFVMLHETGDEHGPFSFYSSDYTRNLVKSGYRARKSYGLDDDAMENAVEKVKLVGAAGTRALCLTSQCLHRAGIPHPGHHRDIVQIQFESSPTAFELGEIKLQEGGV